MNPIVERLEALLAAGKETALLRCTLGQSALDAGDGAKASEHLQRAVALDPHYSVAWKLLGKARLAQGEPAAAREAWNQGIASAEAKGDAQVGKELRVFLKRLDKQEGGAG